MLCHVSLFEVHTVSDRGEIVVDFIKLVHEHVCLTLLILLLTLFSIDAILEPDFLLLKVFLLDLLLELHDVALLLQTVDDYLSLSKGTALISVRHLLMAVKHVKHLHVA